MTKLKEIRHFFAEIKSALIDKGRKLLSPIRKKKINRDFCIISNNCWGGKVYQRYGKPYNSPTVGLYFFADEYIRFLKNLDYYLSIDLRIIPPEQSRYYEKLVELNQTKVPIGCIDDVEIVFLHYKTGEEAIEKWNRRKKRINRENLIIKFSRMNSCTDEHIKEFDKLNYRTKFVFNNAKMENIQSLVYIPGYDESEQILDDTTKYYSYIDLEKLINNNEIVSKIK